MGNELAGRKLLVVDDDVDTGELLGELLALSGAEVRVVQDAESALEAVASFAPDTALLDLNIGGTSGHDLARQIVAATPGKSPRLIAVTGTDEPAARRESAEAGFFAHLVKPLEAKKVVAILLERG